MAELEVQVLQSNLTRAASANLWKGCPLQAIRDRVKSGFIIEDDFTTLTAAGTNAALSQYKVTGTTGTAVLIGTDDGGVVSMRPSTSANNEAYLVWGQTTGACGQILNATPNQVWFEARVRVQDIINGAYFVGLAKFSDVTSGFLVATTGVVASTKNAVGFSVANATPANLDVVYAKAAAPTVYKANAKTLVSAAGVAGAGWCNVGLHYFGSYGGGKDVNQVRFYINGIEIANGTTTTVPPTGVAANATNFPSSVALVPCFCAQNSLGTVSTANLDVDWFRYVQIIDDATFGVNV